MKDKPRLLILNASCMEVIEYERVWIESLGIELLANSAWLSLDPAATLALMQQCEGVILPAMHRQMPTEEDLRQCPRLRVCSIAASGYEWLDIEAASKHGVVVTYAPGGDGAEVVADMVWGLMFAVARQIPYYNQLLRQGDETRGIGTSVYGKTLGILGLGQIGRATARRARGFDMKVIAADPFPDRTAAAELNVTLVSEEELLENADFVSLHMRLSEKTRHCIGERELRRMKQSAYLINTARRDLVDEGALVKAIEEKWIAGAALDDPPGEKAKTLLGLPNVVFTPHLGNRAVEGMRGVLRTAVINAVSVFRGDMPALALNSKPLAEMAYKKN